MPEQINFNQIFTLYQAAVTGKGVKPLAAILKKSDKTIYAEMSLENLQIYLDTIDDYDDRTGKPSYLPKQGLVDFCLGMAYTGDCSPLVAMASEFCHACYPLPPVKLDTETASRAVSKFSQTANKECSETFSAVIEALAGDGKVDKKEARDAFKECMEGANAMLELAAVLKKLGE